VVASPHQSVKDRLFLVGPMGVGKTTIGQLIAQSLGWSFFDSDKEIVDRTGAQIPLIFELEGEEGFRKRESAVIEDLTLNAQCVLATGGGVVLQAENRACLKERGQVVYLQAAVEKLLERTHKDRNRPLLQTENPQQKLENIIEERDPLYREIADFSIDTGKHSVKDVVREIIHHFQLGK
jgi:shikimate kinase